MRNSVLVVALVLVASAVQAKCITKWHTVSGAVTSTTGQPLADAKVEVRWMEMRGKHTREASAVSDSSGQFEVRVPFNLISDGAPSGDVCKGQLEQVSLRVSRLGYQPRKQAIKVTGERITANLALTPITVEPAIQELQR